jgi:hypothetical protein
MNVPHARPCGGAPHWHHAQLYKLAGRASLPVVPAEAGPLLSSSARAGQPNRPGQAPHPGGDGLSLGRRQAAATPCHGQLHAAGVELQAPADRYMHAQRHVASTAVVNVASTDLAIATNQRCPPACSCLCRLPASTTARSMHGHHLPSSLQLHAHQQLHACSPAACTHCWRRYTVHGHCWNCTGFLL